MNEKDRSVKPMLTFALDEYGDFEGLKTCEGPVYIAGLIYDDRNVRSEERLERNRIQAYYKAVISEAAEMAGNPDAFIYPDALHSNGDSIRDHTVVRPVKALVGETLSEFIRRGSYKGSKLSWTDRQGIARDFRDRGGEYHIFVILKSNDGIKKLLRGNANILARDDYASNLYFHMADELITRLVFYNPVIREVKDITLDIATRTSADMDRSDPVIQEYIKQGYQAKKCDENNPNSRVYFRLTNPDVYRSVIAKEILDAEQTDIVISDFSVRSIRYRADARRMEFLYLADTICSALQFGIKGDDADAWLRDILARVKNLTGREENLIFGYDEIDVVYAKAWAKYEQGDYYKALSIAFDACRQEGAFAEYYKRQWFRKLEEGILGTEDVSAFNMAVRKLNETLNNNTLDQDKALYIFQVLEKLAPKMEGKFRTPEAGGILYTLYNIGVTVYCHIGDSKSAEKYFEKCTECAGVVSLDEYLNTRNRFVVYCCDYFELDRAKELSDENMAYQELLTELKRNIHLPGVSESGYAALGKAHSQRAQVYAFLRDPGAEDEFRLALDNFEAGSANYKITQSYLLHHYLDMGNKEAYLSEAENYFDGRRKLEEQLQYILDEGSRQDPLINMKYALYIFVKALYLFRLSEMPGRVWKNLQGLEKKFGKKIAKQGWKLTGHPVELIFKYMSLIAMARGEDALERQYAERMSTCLIYHGVTEDAIRKFGELELANEKGNTALRDELSVSLYRFLSENFTIFENIAVPADGASRYQWLREQMSFMYR